MIKNPLLQHKMDLIFDGPGNAGDGRTGSNELIRRKEEELDLPHIPIITQTARAMKHIETKCLEAGADKFVSKPIKRRKLYRSILDLLS